MTIYLELILGINFYLDLLILMTTSIVLKRHSKFKRILGGALVGTLTMVILIIPLNQIELLLYKIGVGLVMNLVAFGYKNLKYLSSNISYFLMIGIILGGFLYYLNLEFRYTSLGTFFTNHGWNLNLIFIFLLTPIILILYIRQAQNFKAEFNLFYPVKIILKDGKVLEINGFLDTGNKLIDPVTNKPIIMLEKGLIDINQYQFMYVPFNSLNNHNLIKCIKPQEIIINNKKYFNYLIGISDKKFNMNGVECILNNKLLEEI